MASPVATPPDTHIGLDTYTLLVEAFINGSRLSQVLSFFDPTGGLPVAPAADDRYISSATANTWIANYIYYWDGDDVGWVQIIPTAGELTYVVAGPTFPATAILWNGIAWSAFGGGSGDVLGPGAATVNAIVRWANVAGTLIANSTVLVTNAGDIQIPAGGCLQINALDTACRDANNNLLYGNANLAGITTGTTNTAIGDGVGAAVTTGTGNILIGTGTNVTTGADSNAVGIGNGVTVASGSIVIGSGSSAVAADSLVFGVGSSDGTFDGAVVLGSGITAFEPDSLYISPNNTQGPGGSLWLVARDGAAAGDGGGFITIRCGFFVATGTANGGSINMITQPTSGSGNAGDIAITAASASGTGDGGSITLTAGTSVGGNAGIININGPMSMPAGEAPATVTKLFSMTTVTSNVGLNTVGVSTGSMAYDSGVTSHMYIFNGVSWDAYSPSNQKSYEAISIAGAGNNPSLTVATTFVTTTAAASGTLANGTSIGQIKYIAISGYAGNYVMSVTSGIDANGAVIATITYTSAGQGSTLTWDGANWLILNAGGIVA